MERGGLASTVFSAQGRAPGVRGRAGEADAIARAAIASRYLVKLSGPTLRWVRAPSQCSPRWAVCWGQRRKELDMSDSSDSHRQQRSRDRPSKIGRERNGFLGQLRNPRTLRLALKVGFCVYRVLRFALRVFEFFE